MSDIRNSRILVVDDTDFNLIILSAILDREYGVLTATAGPQAIAIAGAERPDLILLDIMMPDMDGFEVCRALKADAATRDIPIIFITALKGAEHTSQGFAVGAVDYITKPFDDTEILARVKTHLSLRKTQQALERQNALLQETIAKQHLGINLAKQIMALINGTPPRYVLLDEGLALRVAALTSPCHAEGGDHYFVRVLPPDAAHPEGRTVISIKDQSGHEVACILRSIITDLAHNALLSRAGATPAATIDRLNNAICASGSFADDAFCTTMTAELDHASRILRFVSAGHPPFLLVRDSRAASIPRPGEPGLNLPLATVDHASYQAGEVRLAPGDRLLFYTDGLTEMPLRHRQQILGRRELEELVTGLVTQQPAMPIDTLIRKLLVAVTDLSGEEVQPDGNNSSADDVSILGVELRDWRHSDERVIRPASPADLDGLASALFKELAPELRRHGFSDPDLRIGLVLGEALANAWKHGSGGSPDKPVTIRWRFDEDFILEILDQGGGFDPAAVADPTSPVNLTKVSGRGVFIINRLADFLAWRDGGRHLVAAFDKTPPATPEENASPARSRLLRLW